MGHLVSKAPRSSNARAARSTGRNPAKRSRSIRARAMFAQSPNKSKMTVFSTFLIPHQFQTIQRPMLILKHRTCCPPISKLATIFVIGSSQEPSSFSLAKLLKKTISTRKRRKMKKARKAKRRRTIQISIPQKSNPGKMRKSASNNRYKEIFNGCLVACTKKTNCMSHFDTSLVTDHYYRKIEFFCYIAITLILKKGEKQQEIFCAFP